jgi:putative ABC transport system permease protein
MAQHSDMSRAVTLIVRSELPTDQVTGIVRRAVAAVDPDLAIYDVVTLEQAIADSFATKRLATVLIGLFAAVAIALAGIGLYAIVAYSVSRRTRDIGIQMALGARPRDVLRVVMGKGWRLAAMGLITGIVAASLCTRVMRGLVFDVNTTDPLTFVLAGSVLGAVTLVASYIPARRAARIDPSIALRHE